jgi:hypothetical protein
MMDSQPSDDRNQPANKLGQSVKAGVSERRQ